MGRPRSKVKPAIRKITEPLKEAHAGYDAICGFCGFPFTFENSRLCGTRDYKNFCTQGCAEGDG